MKQLLLGMALSSLLAAPAALAQLPCPAPAPGDVPVGPWDYHDPVHRDPNKNTSFGSDIRLVEGAHFTPVVEQLVRGKTDVTAGGDIDYTLRAFPNHPRALDAMSRLTLKEKTSKPKGARYSIDCYFERALRFRPRDYRVMVLYGNHKARYEKLKEALDLYREAEKIAPDSVNVTYNMGLAYYRLKEYDQALLYAKKAYAKGMPEPGLRNKLKGAGKWNDDPLPAAEAAAAPAEPGRPDAGAAAAEPARPDAGAAPAAPPAGGKP